MKKSAPEDYWSQHIQAWQDSGLSQSDYCRQHKLKANRFWYWKSKLTTIGSTRKPQSLPLEPSSAFIPLTVEDAPESTNRLRLRLPNGCELSGIDIQHLPTINQLLKTLL